MMVLIVFNLILPTGWQVGLIRIEDVVVGGAGRGGGVAAAVAARRRRNAVSAAVDAAFDVGTQYLRDGRLADHPRRVRAGRRSSRHSATRR